MNTDEHLFLISFNGTKAKFLTNSSGMGDVVKTHNKYGIVYIKIFNSVKDAFIKLSKKDLISLIDCHTHSFIEVQRTNYIKS